MTLADLLRETIDLPEQEVWENERTSSMGLSLRVVVAVLDARDRSLSWNWVELDARSRRSPI